MGTIIELIRFIFVFVELLRGKCVLYTKIVLNDTSFYKKVLTFFDRTKLFSHLFIEPNKSTFFRRSFSRVPIAELKEVGKHSQNLKLYIINFL